MTWDPAVMVVTAGKVATPPTRDSADPTGAPSIANWTKPVGVPVAGAIALTCVTKVTPWPGGDGLAEDDTVVELVGVTDKPTLAEAGPNSFPSVEAVNSYGPGARSLIGTVAMLVLPFVVP